MMALVSVLPHSKQGNLHYVRKNNNFSLEVEFSSLRGEAYGTIPRLILLYLMEYVAIHKQQEIPLGRSVYAFMKSIGVSITTNRKHELIRQMKALFSATIRLVQNEDNKKWGFDRQANFLIADTIDFFWEKADNEEQDGLFESKVALSKSFFRELMVSKLVYDKNILIKIKNNSMAIDIYLFLQYRVYVLNTSKQKNACIKWEQLSRQFGHSYARQKDFKRKFKEVFSDVCELVPSISFEFDKNGLELRRTTLVK